MSINYPPELVAARNNLDIARAAHAKTYAVVSSTYEQWKTLNEKFVMETFKATDNKWEVILNPDFADIGGEFYDAANKFVSNTYGLGVRLSGINGITMQRCPSMSFYRDDAESNNKIRQMILDTLPFMIPYSKDMKDGYGRSLEEQLIGYCYYDILERGLSEYASYSVYISHEQKIVVGTNRYGSRKYSAPMEFDEGLDYLRQNLYYESSSTDDEDED